MAYQQVTVRSESGGAFVKNSYEEEGVIGVLDIKKFKEYSPIGVLNDDCLIVIFSMLSLRMRLEIEQVSTRWRDVSRAAWHDVKTMSVNIPRSRFSAFRRRTAPKSINREILARCGYYLTNLSLIDPTDTCCLEAIRDNCPNLKRLRIELKSYTKKHFLDAFSCMTEIRFVEIVCEQQNDITGCLESLHDDVEEIILRAETGCDYDEIDEYWEKSLSKFKALRSLSLRLFNIGEAMIQDISNNKGLIHLDLQHCFVNPAASLMPLSNIASLEHLQLPFISSVCDNLLRSIANNCKNLKVLNITGCSQVTGSGIISLQRLEKLEVLLMKSIHLAEENDLRLDRFFNLKELDCSDNESVDDGLIMRILDASKHLKVLNAKSTGVTIETPIHAVTVTNQRGDKFTLELMVDRCITETFGNLNFDSPFLIISGGQEWH